jgi:hypothetical protein
LCSNLDANAYTNSYIYTNSDAYNYANSYSNRNTCPNTYGDTFRHIHSCCDTYTYSDDRAAGAQHLDAHVRSDW